MSELIRQDPRPVIDDLEALRLLSPGSPEVPPDMAIYYHESRDRTLTVIFNTDIYEAWQAHAYHFGVRRWRHVSVSVQGALRARLADQQAIGRAREGGERSPAPLPDWYDLTHIAYAHWAEFGFDPASPVFQLLPPPMADGSYLNIAEALHLRQPA